MTVNGQIMKIAVKKNRAEFSIPSNGEFYFFFCLQGQSEIEMAYAVK
jgi:YHS domain-containing protein